MRERDPYRIDLAGKWALIDFYDFPHVYNQVYSFLYCLDFAETLDEERLKTTYQAYPWRGGYSAVNFYNYLYYTIPKGDRPTVVSVRYSSPGWIDLGLAVGVAFAIRRIVRDITVSVRDINTVYSEIHTELQKRKLLRIKVKSRALELKRADLRFVEESAETLSRLMGFDNLQRLNELTESPLATLKMLLSFYRRIRALKKYQDNGKLEL